MSWSLTYNGTTKSFAEWGLSNLRRSRVSQAQDTVSFSAPGPYDAVELFPYGAIITISYVSGPTDTVVTPWFLGRVVQVPRSGSGTEESMDYELAGPWWFLDNLVYQQVWSAGIELSPHTLAADEIKLGEVTVYDETTEQDIVYDRIGVYKSRVILGQDHLGAQRTSGEVITDVISFAMASGAPIAMGTIASDLQIPFDEQQDVTCSEVIRRMLRWSPDAVTWFDYSTAPYPTFNCARRASLQSLPLPLQPNSGSQISNNRISNLQVTPRSDLIVPAVILKYEQTNTINEVEYESVITDKWPANATGREFGALIATLQLAGSQAQYLSQKITEVKKWGEDWWSKPDFWRYHDPSIKDEDTFELSFVSGTPDPGLHYPNELIIGQIQDWMNVYSKRYTITAVAEVNISDSEGNIIKTDFRTLSCEIVVTDAKAKTYTKLASMVTGESIPVGLAKALYDSLNPLQFEGSITLTEEECGGVATVLRAASGFVLNLTGGPSDWETMNALIQKVDEDVDSGRTTISFGPAEQLSPQDLIERLRANRGRGVAFNFLKRTTGESSSGSATVAMSGPTPLLNTASGAGQTKLLVVTDNARKITLNPAQITAEGVTELKTVAATVVLATGRQKSINILASEPFLSLPTVPTTGTFVLVCVAGVLDWVALEIFACPT